jgi:hypothetical protein
MKHLAWMILAIVPFAAAQPLTPFYLWYLTDQPTTLPDAPSSTDLVQGFPEVTTDGVLQNEVINESFYGEFDGLIDPFNNVTSYLIPDNVCLQIGTAPSDGFLPGYGGNPGQFVDGVLNGATDGLLRDYGAASLVLRFGFTNPTDIGAVRVIGGNLNPDGRTFHHYDVWASIEGLGTFGTYFLVAEGVRTGEFATGNPGLWRGSETELHDFDRKTLVAGVTDLRIVFWCVDNTGSFFIDQWQGLANESPEFIASCGGFGEDPEDNDGYRRAFVGSLIREIDVFAPGDITPWGDINYDDRYDMVDAAAFQACPGDLTTNGCFRFDFDENDALDAADVDTFGGLMNGPA